MESAQYLAIRYTERLAEAEAVNSVGSKGDSYDNALAESVNGLYKGELMNRRGPLAIGRAGRARDRRVGRLVEPWAAPRGPWSHPAGRVRGGLCSLTGGAQRRLIPRS